jgi:hypothetical protein
MDKDCEPEEVEFPSAEMVTKLAKRVAEIRKKKMKAKGILGDAVE